MLELTGKRIFVTAAAAGIGRAIAETAERQGAEVLATDIDTVSLAAIEGGSLGVATLDVTDPEAVAALFAGEEPFDGIVNAAGFVHHGTILDCTPQDWRRSFAINVDSMYHVLSAALPGMIARGGGSIVNIASVASSLKGIPNRFVYGASKAAVIGLTKAIAADFVGKGIRCNAICPGTIESPSLESRIRALGETAGGYEAARKAFVDRQPMGRLGTPQEVANLAVYLLSDASAFTTGQAHVIDGGILA